MNVESNYCSSLTTFTREADAKLVEIVSDIEAIRASPYISALGQRLEQETGNTGSLSTTEPLGEGIQVLHSAGSLEFSFTHSFYHQEEKITIEEDLVLESDISVRISIFSLASSQLFS